MQKVSWTDWLLFQRAMNAGAFPHERLGQAFVNRFFPYSGSATSALFYQRDAKKAREIILSQYVEVPRV